MIHLDEIEHAADCTAFLAEEAEAIADPELAQLLDEAGWLLGRESAIEDMSFNELACAIEDAQTDIDDPEHEADVIAALLDLRQRVDTALRRYGGWQPWECGRVEAFCQIGTAVLSPTGEIRAA